MNRRTGFAVLAAIVLLEIARGIEEIALLPILLADRFGFGAGTIGLVLSSYLVADLVCRLPAGWLSDRVGRRPVLIAGMVIAVVAVPLLAIANDLPLLVAANVLNGIGAGTMWPAVYALVAESFPAERRGAAMSVVNLCMIGGLASGPILGNLAIGVLSSQPTFVLCFVITLIALAIGVLLLQEPVRVVDEALAAVPATGGLVFIAAASVLSTLALAMLLPIVTLFGRDVLGLSFTGLALVMAGPALLAILAIVPAGVLADRTGRRSPTIAGSLLIALPLALAPVSVAIPIVILGAAVAAIGYALVAPAINALLLDALPAGSRGGTAGFVVALQGLGIAFGPAIGGQLYEQVGHYAPLIGASLVLLAAALLVVPVRERGKLSNSRRGVLPS